MPDGLTEQEDRRRHITSSNLDVPVSRPASHSSRPWDHRCPVWPDYRYRRERSGQTADSRATGARTAVRRSESKPTPVVMGALLSTGCGFRPVQKPATSSLFLWADSPDRKDASVGIGPLACHAAVVQEGPKERQDARNQTRPEVRKMAAAQATTAAYRAR
jgi:hypothetical protein